MLRKNIAGQYQYFALVDARSGTAINSIAVAAGVALDNSGILAALGSVSVVASGQYQFNPAASDTNANHVGWIFTAANAVPVNVNLITTGGDFSDGVRYGLTSLPNAAAEAAGGLYTRGTGAGQINQDANGRVDANMAAISQDTTAADNLEASTEVIVAANAAAGTLSATQMSTDLTEDTDDHYVGRTLVWRTGTLAGQATQVTAYDGTGKVLTFLEVTEAPLATDTFVLL
jgi:hypothetical protein